MRYEPRLIALFVLTLEPATSLAADVTVQQQKALDVIADFADRLCKSPPLQGQQTSLELSGTAKAELNEVVRKIVDLGIEGAAKYTNSEWNGFLQKDLAAIVKDSANCRLEVWRDLKDKLVPKTTESSPNAGTGAPPTTACPTSSPINMVGKVASDIPGTPLQLCQAVTSVIDRNTRPVDVYSVELQAGQSVRLRIQCNHNCSLNFWNPNTTRIANTLSAVHRVWSSRNREDSWEYTAAVSGTYPVSITPTHRSSVRYTASVQPVK